MIDSIEPCTLARVISRFFDHRVPVRLSMAKDYSLAAVKLVAGLSIASSFVCASGFYSIILGLAKHAYFRGRARAGNDARESGLLVYTRVTHRGEIGAAGIRSRSCIHISSKRNRR
jgi:hypothetical protein